jgi:hypothetical protein
VNAFPKFRKRKLASFVNEIDLEAAVGEGVVVSPDENSRSWVPIEEICNGEWSIGGRH